MGALGTGARAAGGHWKRLAGRLRSAALGSAIVTASLGACARDTERPGADSVADSSEVAAPQLIDSAIPPAVAGADGWNYQLSAEADLTGDGQPERVVLTARVELYRGRPAWDDGQPWQVYVEHADSMRTYVYAQRLQLGTLTLRIAREAADAPATIVLLEHLPDRMSVYEVAYASPESVTVKTRFQRVLDPRGQLAAPALP